MGVRQKENLDINTAQIYTDEIKPLNVTLQSVKSVNILLFFFLKMIHFGVIKVFLDINAMIVTY